MGLTYQWLIVTSQNPQKQESFKNLIKFIGEKNGCFATLEMVKEAAKTNSDKTVYLNLRVLIDANHRVIPSSQRIGIMLADPSEVVHASVANDSVTSDGVPILKVHRGNLLYYDTCGLANNTPFVIVTGNVKTVPIEQR